MNKDDDLTIIGSSDITLDISNQGAACETYVIDYNDNSNVTLGTIDTIDLSGITTFSGSGATVGGIYTGTSPTYTTINTTGTGYSYSNYTFAPEPSTVEINTDGIKIKDDADIKVGDVSLKEFMKTMQERLAILVPDPKKLEKFEALKKAYEHYKTLESLCFDESKKDDSNP